MATRKNTWSLIELTIILVVLSILCAILAPVIDRYVRNAKVVRAREDVQALGSAIVMFIEDTANSYFLQDGSPDQKGGTNGRPNQHWSNRVDILISDGDIPECGPNGEAEWVKTKGGYDCVIDFFEYHLVTNNPLDGFCTSYRTPTDLINPGHALMFARDESGGFNSEFAWRGPYITAPIDPDPWGNRYAANVKFLDPRADTGNSTAASNGFEEDVVIISAGPDEEIDTAWDVDGLTPGDDDILYTLSGNSRP